MGEHNTVESSRQHSCPQTKPICSGSSPAAQKRKRPAPEGKPLILLVLLTGIELVTY